MVAVSIYIPTNNPTTSIYPEETIVEKDMFPDIHGSTIYNSQDVEAT